MKSFLNWIVESEENPSLAEPQHKNGEANMRLDDIVERRMKQIIMELEGAGKGTQQEILTAVQKYLKSKNQSTSDPSQQPTSDQGQQPNMQQNQQPNAQMNAQPPGGIQ